MNWFTDHRQAWIAETVHIFGFIRRDHLMRKFGVSIAQASKDLAKFQEANPGVIVYDRSSKRYVLEKD